MKPTKNLILIANSYHKNFTKQAGHKIYFNFAHTNEIKDDKRIHYILPVMHLKDVHNICGISGCKLMLLPLLFKETFVFHHNTILRRNNNHCHSDWYRDEKFVNDFFGITTKQLQIIFEPKDLDLETYETEMNRGKNRITVNKITINKLSKKSSEIKVNENIKKLIKALNE